MMHFETNVVFEIHKNRYHKDRSYNELQCTFQILKDFSHTEHVL